MAQDTPPHTEEDPLFRSVRTRPGRPTLIGEAEHVWRARASHLELSDRLLRFPRADIQGESIGLYDLRVTLIIFAREHWNRRYRRRQVLFDQPRCQRRDYTTQKSVKSIPSEVN